MTDIPIQINKGYDTRKLQKSRSGLVAHSTAQALKAWTNINKSKMLQKIMHRLTKWSKL